MISKILEKLPHLRNKIKIDDSAREIYQPTNLLNLEIQEEFGEKVMRYYQKESLERAKKNGRGILVMGTGAGKSLVIASLIQSFLKKNPDAKILLTVPQVNLVTQYMGDFEDYECTFKVSPWYGSHEIDKSASVYLVTHSMLNSRYKTESKWINEVNMVISDEVHTVSEKSGIAHIVSKINTPNKFGFTGTLSKEETDRWHSIGAYGNVIYKKSAMELREEKFLTGCTVFGIRIEHPVSGRMDYISECSYISNSASRNNRIAEIINLRKGNFLILVNYIQHGENLLESCKKSHPTKKVYFVTGDTPDDERERIRKEMEQRDDCVLIAISKIFSTGVNITNLPNIILAMGGKAYIRLVQTIGRGLRLHENKTRLCIFDVYDSLKYSFSHFQDRKEIYAEEGIKLIEKE